MCYDTKLCSDSSCCSKGYHWSADSGCVDTDECSLPDSPCAPSQVCRNTPGSFECLQTSSSRSDRSSQSVKFSCYYDAQCPSGMACININGSWRCADPCEHYIVLNDTWRSTNYTVDGNPHCDNDYLAYQGWYRLFLGQNNAHIPESCVEENRCGTNYPIWMKTPHPTQSDEIESCILCTSKGHCCSVQDHRCDVKLCYGNYYVYKLWNHELSDCNFTYCAGNNMVKYLYTVTTNYTFLSNPFKDPQLVLKLADHITP